MPLDLLEPPTPEITPDVEPHNGRSEYRIKVPGQRARIGGQILLIWLVLNFQRIVAPVGRRFGKTTGLLFVIPELAARTDGMCYVGIWNQDHGKAEELMEVFITAYGGDPRENAHSLISKIKRARGQTRYIELKPMSRASGEARSTGTRIYFWSAVHPHYNKVRGFTHPFHLIVGDESSYLHGNAILKVSLKMLADCGGKFLAIGTPDIDGVGFAWFSTFWARAMSDKPEWKDWTGMTFPSEANPTITLRNIATMRSECMSRDEERQEIDAVFLDDTSSVFGPLGRVFDGEYMVEQPEFLLKAARKAGIDMNKWRAWVADKPREDVYYVMGVDWARKVDNTVITVFRKDTLREVLRVEIDGDDWDEQLHFVLKLRRAFGRLMSVYSDATGVGDGMTQILLRKYNEPVTPVVFKAFDKERAVRTLAMLFRIRQVHLINAVDSREQFRLFQGVRNEKTGRVSYSAPDGEHDDHVDATLLIVDQLLTPLRMQQDEDGAGIEEEAPPAGTWAEIRKTMDESGWVDQIDECRIGPDRP